jgi:hypothetical protein
MFLSVGSLEVFTEEGTQMGGYGVNICQVYASVEDRILQGKSVGSEDGKDKVVPVL